MKEYTIHFQPAQTVKNKWCRGLRWTRGTLFGAEGYGVGIDPGVNFGLTILQGNFLDVYHGTLKREEKPGMYGWDAFMFLKELLDGLQGEITASPCVIEGAAYHKMFGQVGLAEVRTSFFLQAILHPAITSVEIVPPATIRKKVFDNHLQQASEIWISLNHNGADSVSMALYNL
jgi:hypothetical protein